MRRIRKQVEINAPVGTVFDSFSRFSNFPRWMRGIVSVQRVAPGRTRWIAETRDGERIEWEVEVTDLELDRLVTWRSISGDLAVEGNARFEAIASGATMMHLTLGYGAPQHMPQDSIAEIFMHDLEERVEDDLERFKHFAEREERAARVHFEPLSQVRRSGQTIVPAQPLFQQEQPLPETADAFRTASSRVESDADDYFLTGYDPYSTASGTRPVSHQPLFKTIMFILMLSLAAGAGWFLASRRLNNSDDHRVADPITIPSTSPIPDKRTDTATTDLATATGPVTEVSPLPDEVAEPDTPNAEATGTGAAQSSNTDENSRQAVRSTLDNWIAAANRKDIDTQMGFYAPVMRYYYLKDNISRDSVRADKAQRFARADSVRINIGEPEITMEQGGRAARVRFRKQYEIAGSGGTESGEVLQELSLVKSGNEWRIVSERDLRVIK
jgi:uncharacterized protein YndB with AHSA1/START domain